ncbi:MAG TPA: MaoC/PaaZ C-terminal domain-containing protein, partial [Blastocatellia bacterium]|nr:MaoC/PaaZ C-terminal domain-containing protein [Blastocatellia bacterium]
MGKYFEDFNIGDQFTTRGRTVIEADIMQYAGLCWDTQAEHTDAEFARRGRFGERIGQQQLGLLIAHGLIASTRVLEDTLRSVLRLGWNFFNPIKIGDTLRVKQTVSDKKDLTIDGSGVITFQIETMNHRGELINRCLRTVLVARRVRSEKESDPGHYVFRGLSELKGVTDDHYVQAAGDSAAPVASGKKGQAQTKGSPQGERSAGAEAKRRGKYFEEFEVGEELVTQARTVAEADVLNYTMLSWDGDPLHTDAEYARSTPYGGVLAPLLLPIVYANGLGATLGFLAGTNRGALGDWWEFVKPVRIGDTLHFRQVIASKHESKVPDTG